jgi:hypothetical protein
VGSGTLLPRDLIATALRLALANPKKPRQSDLKRAVSSTYYAMFHTIAKASADSLIGVSKAERANRAWQQVYRGLNHGPARSACKNSEISRFPQQIQDFASIFVEMQAKRNRADYDPFFRVYKHGVLADIEDVRQVINDFAKVSVNDKKAFAVWVLFQQRS